MRATFNTLADEIDHRPDILRHVPIDLVERIQLLTAGFGTDLDQPLSPELDAEDMP